jgi:hypothetical protein
MKTIRIAIVILSLAFICQKSLASDFKTFMARQDMVWDTLTGYFYDGIPTGNGLLGTLLHRQDAARGDGNTNTLLFEINRTDLVDSCQKQQEGYNWERKAVGKFALTPKGIILSASARLNLYDAQATGQLTTNKGEIQFKFYTHATLHVQVLEYEWSGNETEPKLEFLPDNAGCMLDFITVDFQEKAKYDEAKPFIANQKNEIFTHQQALNAKRSFTVGWIIKKEKNKLTLYHTIAYSHPVAAPKFSVESILSNTITQNIKFETQHLDWWHKFYEQSTFVSLSDSLYENFYWAQLYKIGSNMRENLQMMDLMGPWYAHTPWRGIWWNWNTQGLYYPLSQINHPELVKPLVEALHKNEKSLEQNLAENLRNQGAIGIGRASSFDLRSDINMEDGPPLYAGREPGNLTWIMHVYYRYLRSIEDDKAIKTEFFPFLKRAIQLYVALIIKKEDGKYHLPLTMSPEFQPAYDCNYDLSLFKWGLKTLIEINRKYEINDPLASKWRDYYKNLVDFPESKYGFMIGKGLDLYESHRHFSHLLMIYPLDLLNLSNIDTALIAIRSVNHWTSIQDGKGMAAWSHLAAAGMYARLFDPIKAKSSMDKAFQSFSASTLYREAGQCAETPIFWLKPFTDMLIKQQNDTILLFPASLTIWKKLRFDKLRIQGAFLVSARCENERIIGTKIESEKGGTLTFIKPSTLKQISISDATVVKETKKFLTITFKPKGKVEFSSSDTGADYREYSQADYLKGNYFGKKVKPKK